MEAPALQLFRGDQCAVEPLPIRGVRWVLGWAAAFVTLGVSAVVLVGFAYQLATEQALARAAAAGIREAALPRATSDSVEAVVRHQLASHALLSRSTKISLQLNGTPLFGVIHRQNDDRISLALVAPVGATLPGWLHAVLPWQQQAVTTTRVELGKEIGG